MMTSRIEQIIDEIEEYIEKCKPQILSSTKIIVDREELEELIAELRSKTPEEIKRYQKMISNKDAILADAQAKADQIIAQAQVQTTELVSEHQIMQQAHAHADEVLNIAVKQAQDILDNATNEANNIRMNAMVYTDAQLRGLEDIITSAIDAVRVRNDSLVSSLQGYLDVVTDNRSQLFPAVGQPEVEAVQEQPEAEAEPGEELPDAEGYGYTTDVE